MTPWQLILSHLQHVGWVTIIGFVFWLWRKSLKASVLLVKGEEQRELALKQITEIHSAATNHLPTAMEALGKKADVSNEHLEEQTKVLTNIDKGIGILVDRGR